MFLSILASLAFPRDLYSKTIAFSGYEWAIKQSEERFGPGPNYFSDSAENVFVDDKKRLHLKITRRDGKWRCAEILLKKKAGYGTYRLTLDAPTDTLDRRAVFGFFTWSDAPEDTHREIDVEYSRWDMEKNENTQYVIQPYEKEGNTHRFDVPAKLNKSVHQFQWSPGRVVFQSFKGDKVEKSSLFHTWTTMQDAPHAGDEALHLNLWLFRGAAPAGGQPVEVVIKKFEFTPEKF